MKKMKRKNIIIFIILFVILFIVICVGIQIIKEEKENKKQFEIVQQKKEQVMQYTNITDFNSIEEVLLYLDSEFISQEDAEDENLDYIVKAKLKYDLNLSYKNYYEKLIEYSASASKYKSFYIIDEEKNIEILVLCNDSQSISSYYINNEKFYFDKLESKENITNITKTEITKINSTCEILEEIISNNWITTNMNLGTKESIYKGYDIYFEEGIELKKVNGKVYNLIYTDKHEENVVENLKVNSNRETIIEQLGEPAFDTGSCMGYKTEKFYIFFSEDEISIYPIYTYSTDEIIQIIEKYENTKDINIYLNEIKQKWPDYDVYKVSNNYIILQYTLKGIVFKYDNTSTQGIVLYNNYNGKIDSVHYIQDVEDRIVDLPNGMNFVNYDLVYQEELNRINALDNYSEKGNYAVDPVLNTSSKFKT